MDNKWRQINHIASYDGNEVVVKPRPLPAIPKELFDLFDIHELEKYLTPEEVSKGGSN
jgi:succinate dehydrogenase / fumarate reductase flavoprotein subunit